MDGHQFRGARIYRDMMLVSRLVCVVGLSVVSGGVTIVHRAGEKEIGGCVDPLK